MSTPLISFRGAGKRLAGRTILQNLDLAIYQGESLAVLGENGVGKSTLLKLIGGLSTLSEGKREVHRRDPEPKIGYVPDRFPKVRFTGYEYLCFMGLIRGIPKDALERRIEELLRIFKLDREASRRPIRQYSKGMIQKINLMQSIIEPPDILLLDEPLSGLDLQTQEELSRILLALKAEGIAIVMTSHEYHLTEKIADRIVLLENGRIQERHIERYRNTVNASKHKEIACELPESEVLAVWSLKTGILACNQNGKRFWFRVHSEQSDCLLKAILDCGGHVHSVLPAEEDQAWMSRGKSGDSK